jgi:hypothetical protein
LWLLDAASGFETVLPGRNGLQDVNGGQWLNVAVAGSAPRGIHHLAPFSSTPGKKTRLAIGGDCQPGSRYEYLIIEGSYSRWGRLEICNVDERHGTISTG